MASHAMFAEIAALAGDPGRAGMLHALMDGRALTATELARVAGIAPQTASGHLGRMTAIGLRQPSSGKGGTAITGWRPRGGAHARKHHGGRSRPGAAQRKRFTVGPRDAALATARTCYDHLAGRLGVAIADALVAAGHAELGGEPGSSPDPA